MEFYQAIMESLILCGIIAWLDNASHVFVMLFYVKQWTAALC